MKATATLSFSIARENNKYPDITVGIRPTEPSSDLGANSTPPFQLIGGSCPGTILQQPGLSDGPVTWLLHEYTTEAGDPTNYQQLCWLF